MYCRMYWNSYPYIVGITKLLAGKEVNMGYGVPSPWGRQSNQRISSKRRPTSHRFLTNVSMGKMPPIAVMKAIADQTHWLIACPCRASRQEVAPQGLATEFARRCSLNGPVVKVTSDPGSHHRWVADVSRWFRFLSHEDLIHHPRRRPAAAKHAACCHRHPARLATKAAIRRSIR